MTVSPAAERVPRQSDVDAFGLTHPGKMRPANADQFLIVTLHKTTQVQASSLPSALSKTQTSNAQAFIFLVVVQVDPKVLALLTLSSVLGAWFGAGIASRLPRRPIQIGIGIGLFAAAFFMLVSQLGMFPAGGTALTLTTGKLTIALAINFILGVTLMLGIGHYAPSLIFFSLLGLDPRAVFPIMMSSGALMAMAGGLRFMKAGCFDQRAALGLTLGGIPGALVAGLIVRSLPLGVLRWMVIIVVLYAAAMMIRSAMAQRSARIAQVA